MQSIQSSESLLFVNKRYEEDHIDKGNLEKHIDEFHMASNMTKQADIKLAFDALPAPLHPGAEKHYREIGVWPRESK